LRDLDFTATCSSSTRLISGVFGALRLGILFLKAKTGTAKFERMLTVPNFGWVCA
jgi:hypothetical protein